MEQKLIIILQFKFVPSSRHDAKPLVSCTPLIMSNILETENYIINVSKQDFIYFRRKDDKPLVEKVTHPLYNNKHDVFEIGCHVEAVINFLTKDYVK